MMVLAISGPVTGSDEEIVVRMSDINYPVQFREKQVKALLNSGSKVNAMNPNHAWKLGLKIRKTNVVV